MKNRTINRTIAEDRVYAVNPNLLINGELFYSRRGESTDATPSNSGWVADMCRIIWSGSVQGAKFSNSRFKDNFSCYSRTIELEGTCDGSASNLLVIDHLEYNPRRFVGREVTLSL